MLVTLIIEVTMCSIIPSQSGEILKSSQYIALYQWDLILRSFKTPSFSAPAIWVPLRLLMLCSCPQIQCLKTAASATLHPCQGCSGTAARILPTAAAGAPVNAPGWGSLCSNAARQLCQPTHAQGAALGMELKHLCIPGSSTLEFWSRAVSQFSCR